MGCTARSVKSMPPLATRSAATVTSSGRPAARRGAAAGDGFAAGAEGDGGAATGRMMPSFVRVMRIAGASMRTSPQTARRGWVRSPVAARAPGTDRSVTGTAIDLAATENSLPSARWACGCASVSVATACSGWPPSFGGAPTTSPGRLSSDTCSPIACAPAASCLPAAIVTSGSVRSSCTARCAGGAPAGDAPAGTAAIVASDTARWTAPAAAARSAPPSATFGAATSNVAAMCMGCAAAAGASPAIDAGTDMPESARPMDCASNDSAESPPRVTCGSCTVRLAASCTVAPSAAF